MFYEKILIMQLQHMNELKIILFETSCVVNAQLSLFYLGHLFTFTLKQK